MNINFRSLINKFVCLFNKKPVIKNINVFLKEGKCYFCNNNMNYHSYNELRGVHTYSCKCGNFFTNYRDMLMYSLKDILVYYNKCTIIAYFDMYDCHFNYMKITSEGCSYNKFIFSNQITIEEYFNNLDKNINQFKKELLLQ